MAEPTLELSEPHLETPEEERHQDAVEASSPEKDEYLEDAEAVPADDGHPEEELGSEHPEENEGGLSDDDEVVYRKRKYIRRAPRKQKQPAKRPVKRTMPSRKRKPTKRLKDISSSEDEESSNSDSFDPEISDSEGGSGDDSMAQADAPRPRRNVDEEFNEQEALADQDYAKVKKDVEELKCCSARCLSKLDHKAVYLHRLKLRQMDKKYRQAFMHGQMYGMCQALPCGGYGGKVNSRITKYFFYGESVCLETWLYANLLNDKTYARVMPLCKKNGPAQIRHGNTGRGRHLPPDAVARVDAFLRLKATTMGCEVPVRARVSSKPATAPPPAGASAVQNGANENGQPPGKKPKKPRAKRPPLPTIWLPSSTSKKSLYEEYKKTLENGAQPVSWGSFYTIWEKILPNMKIRKPPPSQPTRQRGFNKNLEPLNPPPLQAFQRLPPPRPLPPPTAPLQQSDTQHSYSSGIGAPDDQRISSPGHIVTTSHLQPIQYVQATQQQQQQQQQQPQQHQHRDIMSNTSRVNNVLLPQPPHLIQPPQRAAQDANHFVHYYYHQ